MGRANKKLQLQPSLKAGITNTAAQGNVQERVYTDKPCLIVFLVLFSIFILISLFGFFMGNPSILAQPFDADHQPCGVGKLADYPYIYFVSPQSYSLYRTVCVKECPQTNDSTNIGTLKCSPNSVVTSCKSNLSPGDADKRTLYYDTVAYTGRVCLPTVSEYFKKVNEAVNANKISQSFSDIRHCTLIICFSGILAMGIGMGIIYYLRKFQKSEIDKEEEERCQNQIDKKLLKVKKQIWMIRIFIMVFVGSLLGLSLFFFLRYRRVSSTEDVTLDVVYSADNQINNQVARADNNIGLYMFYSIISFIFALIVGGLGFLLQKRINLSAFLVRASVKMTIDYEDIVKIIPFISYGIIFAFFLFWMIIATNLYSCGTVTDQPRSLPFGQFQFNMFIRYIGLYHLFSLVWMTLFIKGVCQFIIQVVCTSYYFEFSRPQITIQQVLQITRYHIGTIFLGSVLTFPFDWIRIIVEFVEAKCEEYDEKDESKYYKFFAAVRDGGQKIMNLPYYKYIRRNSYILTIALKHNEADQTGFIEAAEELDELYVRIRDDLDREYKIRSPGLGETFDLLASFSIMFFSTLFCFLLITRTEYYRALIHSPICPTICMMVLSYFVGNMFMSIIGKTGDTLIVLGLMDYDMGNRQRQFADKGELIEFYEMFNLELGDFVDQNTIKQKNNANVNNA